MISFVKLAVGLQLGLALLINFGSLKLFVYIEFGGIFAQ
jgi:hypothetical protein